jgi:hypothetical protein
MAKIKPMQLAIDNNKHVNLLIERDSGNPILILMGKKEYALPSWQKLRGLCNKAIWELQGEERYTTCELLNAVKQSNLPSEAKQELIESLEQWAENNL